MRCLLPSTSGRGFLQSWSCLIYSKILTTTSSSHQVKSNVPSNRWIFVILTWSRDRGLHLYINGEDSAKTTDVIEMQFHNNAKNSKISIGRENTGKQVRVWSKLMKVNIPRPKVTKFLAVFFYRSGILLNILLRVYSGTDAYLPNSRFLAFFHATFCQVLNTLIPSNFVSL